MRRHWDVERESRIVAVLRHYGADPPEGYGDTWRAMHCPFHEDTRPSAALNEHLDAFSCLGCGVKGNSVTLVMDREGMDSREADAFAATCAGDGDGAVRADSTGSARLSGSARDRPGSRGYVPPRLRGRSRGGP